MGKGTYRRIGHSHPFSFERAHRLVDEARRQRQPVEPLVERLELKRGHRVLDLGAGTGYLAIPIVRRLRALGGGTVIAADVEPRMLDHLTARATELGLTPFVQLVPISDSSPTVLPIARTAVDLALVVNLYHELRDRSASLAELRRVLRPDAPLWIVDWDPDGTTDVGPPREHRVPADLVWRELLDARFGSIQRLPLYSEHYTLVARRM